MSTKSISFNGAKSRLFLIVQDSEHRIISDAVVLVRKPDKPFSKIPFSKPLQRYIANNVEAGNFEVQVKGPEGYLTETRQLMLTEGDNHIQVMLGKPEMLSFTANGMKYYFDAVQGVLFLSFKGQNAQKPIIDFLKSSQIEFKELPDSLGKYRSDDKLLLLEIGTGETAKASRIKIHNFVNELAAKGVSANLGLPVYKKDEVAFGITNEIIVKFKSGVTLARIKEMADFYGLTLERNIPYISNAVLFKSANPLDYDILKIINTLEKQEEVSYAEPNTLHRLQSAQYKPNDYLFPEVPHLQLINCDKAWQKMANLPCGTTGGSPNITIAVLDIEGVDPTHPDLTGALSDGNQKMIANFDFVNMTNQTFSNLPGDHGTQCSGSATANMDNGIGIAGVAPNCHLIGGRMSGNVTTLEIADMLVWMAGFPTGSQLANFPNQLMKGADVISNSWGPTSPMPSDACLHDVFAFLTTYGRGGKGSIVCFATGNLGYVLVDNFNPFSADPRTIGIGASINVNPTNPCNSSQPDQNGNRNNLPAAVDTRSYYSPYGLTVDIVSSSHTCYDPALPSFSIRDPILAPVRTNLGDWPGNAVTQTTLTNPVAVGETTLKVANSSGFSANEYLLLNGPGVTPNETKKITAVASGSINIAALEHAYPASTTVSTGPNDYAKNPIVGFGGTSHACPTVAGAIALLLSIKADLTWIEARNILRTTAIHIDPNQTFNTGQWIDLDGDGVADFSQWYGYGRLDVDAAVTTTINLKQRSDLLIRDNLNDNGSVPSAGWHADSPDIWVRTTDDPIPTLPYTASPPHENPIFGQDNYVYLRIRNVGQGVASTAYARALITHFPGVEFQYPADWEPTTRFGEQPTLPLQPGTYLIGEVQINNLPVWGDTIVKMTWNKDLVPPEEVSLGGNTVTWHPCILADVSPHDGPAPVADAYPVRGDNNIAQKNIAIEYPTQGSSSSTVAVAVGTRYAKGTSALLIDRSHLPSNYQVMIQTPVEEIMSNWLRLAKDGKGFEQISALGKINDVNEKPIGRFKGLIESEFGDKQALKIDYSQYTISLPMRLPTKRFIPVFFNIVRPAGQNSIRGVIRISQKRADGEISPGYEIQAVSAPISINVTPTTGGIAVIRTIKGNGFLSSSIVTVVGLDPNGNFVSIGSFRVGADGAFTASYQPSISGRWTITATDAGKNTGSAIMTVST